MRIEDLLVGKSARSSSHQSLGLVPLGAASRCTLSLFDIGYSYSYTHGNGARNGGFKGLRFAENGVKWIFSLLEKVVGRRI